MPRSNQRISDRRWDVYRALLVQPRTTDEVAAALETHRETVRTHIYRARNMRHVHLVREVQYTGRGRPSQVWGMTALGLAALEEVRQVTHTDGHLDILDSLANAPMALRALCADTGRVTREVGDLLADLRSAGLIEQRTMRVDGVRFRRWHLTAGGESEYRERMTLVRAARMAP